MRKANFNNKTKKKTFKNKQINKNLSEEYDDIETKEGRVIEALPAALFKVKFDDGSKEMICFLKGKIKVFKIKILVGDRVQVELDPYGGKGRIIRRI